MTPLPPVLAVPLFPEERAALLHLLSSLAPDQWAAPTVCPGWSVKDIAAHLLGDDLGRLSRGRDRFAGAAFVPHGGEPFETQLLAFINQQNDLWVRAARRLSPGALIDLLRFSGEATQRYFESLDLFALGAPVSWAGPEPAPAWLDIAREYTERWHHQAQLRDALAAPPLTEPRLFAPVLDTFVRALPHTFRGVASPEGTHVRLVVTGVGAQHAAPSLAWSLLRREGRWALDTDFADPPSAAVTLDQDTAWRLFTKGITKAQALPRASLSGDLALAGRVLDTVSVIA